MCIRDRVGLDVADCTFGKDGLTVTLRRSKTDQEGQGRKIGIPYGSNPETCPVRNIQAWLEVAGINSGSLFRSITRHGRVRPGRSCYQCSDCWRIGTIHYDSDRAQIRADG